MGFITQAPPPAPWIVDCGNLAIGNSGGVLAANTVYLYAFDLSGPATITGVHWRNTATVTGTTDAGIYDVNGNLLAHTGAVNNTANTQNGAAFTSGNLYLPAGKYFVAICPSNSTDTYARVNNIQVGSSVNAIARNFTATNNGSAGVLPATTGGKSAASNMPAMAAAILNGL